MRVLPVGEAALLLECGGTDQVRAAYAEARRRQAAGELDCVDIVPAAETLLLDGLADRQSVLAGIEDWPDDLPEDLEDRQVELRGDL